jgi:hypothetical protein
VLLIAETQAEAEAECTAEVMECVAEIELALAPFNARPHWGKLFTPHYMTKERVAQLYPELPKVLTFLSLRFSRVAHHPHFARSVSQLSSHVSVFCCRSLWSFARRTIPKGSSGINTWKK